MLSLTWEEHGNVKFGMKEPEWILQLGMGMKMGSADPPLPPACVFHNLHESEAGQCPRYTGPDKIFGCLQSRMNLWVAAYKIYTEE